MDMNVSIDLFDDSSMEEDDNILDVNIAAYNESFKSSTSLTQKEYEPKINNTLIQKSTFHCNEVDMNSFMHLNENDFHYSLPKSLLGEVSTMVPVTKIINDEMKHKNVDFIASLLCGDALTLYQGIPNARCHIGFPADRILVYPMMADKYFDLYFLLSKNNDLALVKFVNDELNVVKKYTDVKNYEIVPEDGQNNVLKFKLKIYNKDSTSKNEEFKLYDDETENDTCSDDQYEMFDQLRHDLKLIQDILQKKQLVLKNQIELKKGVFEDTVFQIPPNSNKEQPIIIKDSWKYIVNQTLIFGFNIYNSTSKEIEDFDFMMTSSTLNSTGYRTAIFSKYSPNIAQFTQDEGYEIFLGPYDLNGTQWVRSCNLKPGQNILVALLKLPRLDVFSKDISFHSILHYTIDEVNLQTPAISTVLNANQLLGNELLPKFKDQKISDQQIFSMLATSSRVVELNIIPHSKEVINSIITSLQSEMHFRPIDNSSAGWFINIDNPMMFQYGLLLKLGISEDGQAKCVVASRSDDQLLLLVQALYMNLPSGFAILSERTRLIQQNKENLDKKLAAAKSLETEMLYIRKIFEEHSEKCPDDIDKCLVRCDEKFNHLLYKLIDQEDITDKIMSQLAI